MANENVSNLVNICLLILRANRMIRDSISVILSKENLSMESWLTLVTLSENAGLSMSELSDSLGMRISGVSKNVDRLAKRALLYRQQDIHDNRRVLLFVSEFGENKLIRLEEEIEKFSVILQGAIQEQELQSIVNILDSTESDDSSRKTL